MRLEEQQVVLTLELGLQETPATQEAQEPQVAVEAVAEERPLLLVTEE